MCHCAYFSHSPPTQESNCIRVMLRVFSWQARAGVIREEIQVIFHIFNIGQTQDLRVPRIFPDNKEPTERRWRMEKMNGAVYFQHPLGGFRRFSVPVPNNPDRIAPRFHQFPFYLRCSLQSTGGKQIRLLSNLFLEVERLGVGVGVGGKQG